MIGTIIRSLGQNPTDHEIHKYWKEMGSKEGIDSSTFIAIMMQILGNKESSFNETSEEVLDAFRVFDKNGEGFISGTNSNFEFSTAISHMVHMIWTPYDIDYMI